MGEEEGRLTLPRGLLSHHLPAAPVHVQQAPSSHWLGCSLGLPVVGPSACVGQASGLVCTDGRQLWMVRAGHPGLPHVALVRGCHWLAVH